MPRELILWKQALVDVMLTGIYDSVLQVATTTGRKEPLMKTCIGEMTFQALLDTGSSVSILERAMASAGATGASHRREVRKLCLATGWSQSATLLRCKIHGAAGSR